MISFLSIRFPKLTAFFILYTFFISGLCNVLYATSGNLHANNYREPYYDRGTSKKNKDFLNGRTGLKAGVRNSNLRLPNNKRKKFIGGPGQPEMAAFKPVGADNMVDLFTGDFSYNIPLLDVGGYPVNIFYSSGVTMDQEASWCGLGWNINPGTISRNMRGLPDDFDGSGPNGDKIKKTQYTKPERTYGVSASGSFEFFGGATKLGLEGGIFYNNMRGIGLEAGISPSIGIGSVAGDPKTAPLTLGWNLKANSQSGGSSSFSISLATKEKNGLGGSLTASLGYHSRMGLQSLHVNAEVSKTKTAEQIANSQKNTIADGDFSASLLSSSISFAYPAVTPTIRSRQISSNYSMDLGWGLANMGAFKYLKLGGYYSEIKLKETETIQPAYGMLNMQKGNTDKDALLDFNRLNDGVYTPNSPTIAIPAYTYDIFSISGEGTGGTFRAYRGDLGNISDAYIETTSQSGHLGVELGGGTYGHGGVNANFVYTPSSSGVWEVGNLAKPVMDFRNSKGGYQSVYFKNPAEKTLPDTAYQNAIGGEDMVRLKMTNVGIGNPLLVPTLMRYTDTRLLKLGQDSKLSEASTSKARDKRSQVISFLNGVEASKVGLDKKILSYNFPYDSVNTTFGCNTAGNTRIDFVNRTDDNIRKPHHISEIDVLMQDGRRYVYGIPVMNVKQWDVTFNKTGNNTTQVSTYNPGTDDVPENNQNGKDGYVEKQELPPYAHSFLLTGLLSPNYVDVKGDGITEDDMGDAIKFNYSKMPSNFHWRTPSGNNSATFSEGLKSDKNDDKSHYIYGEREMWYLYSIESKNMVARFYVKNDRRDSKSVINENGALNTNWGAQRLHKISLFSKADLIKNGPSAKPVKTIHFSYDYSLCGNVSHNDGLAIDRNGGELTGTNVSDPNKNINIKKGKLTLRSIYFTYNGNEKAKRNYYKFSYPSDAVKNPDYDFTAVDRWGNYKPASANPSGLKNPDYPYVNQDKSVTDAYSQAWVLNNITLPSGGSIQVDYESDDYAFVQDRRASQMFAIAGFGKTATPTTQALSNNTLYQNKNDDNDYIYISVTKSITATTTQAQKKQIEEWYLGNLTKSRQLFMKLYVNLEKDKENEELIPVYAEIDGTEYGVIPGTGGSKIYIKVKKLESGYTPMVQYTLQFMKNFLPAIAYPGYDVKDEAGMLAVVKALGGLYHSFKELSRSGMTLFKQESKCKYVQTSKSFVRLTQPDFVKFGGGLRVKKIVINDNWDKMTKSVNANDGIANATYGQEYFYTKKELTGGEMRIISSGVASWEPSIGGEENPHREMMSYFNRNPKGPFDYSSVELPLAEMFFPSPSVGYSRVEVKSIHRDTVKNAPGIQVTEHYTTREFPTTSNYTPLEEYDATDSYEPKAILRILKIDAGRAVALSQGFKVDLNDMNGKVKKQATYSPLNLVDPISYTENFYNTVLKGENKYDFNHRFPVIDNATGEVKQNAIIGRDVEIMTDFREHKQKTVTTNVNFNLDVISGLFIPIPVPTVFVPVAKESNTYRSAAILKIVNHYSVLDSVVAVDKGSMVSTKNLVYDAETGDVVVSRTNNEHNKPLYNFSYPSHLAYSGMGPAYKNIDVTYSGITFRYGKLETGGVDMSLFESGDELYVIATNDIGPGGIQPCDAGTGPLSKNNAVKIWAVNTAKVGSLTPQILFIDAEGNPYTAKDVTFRIIRSGKRNMLGNSLGSVTSLNTPVQTVSGVKKIVFDNNTAVLQTSAATYKDHWRVDNVFYKKDSLIGVQTYGRVRRTDYLATSSYQMTADYKNRDILSVYGYGANTSELLARYRSFKKDKFLKTDTWVKFDYASSPIPADAQVYAGKLSLFAHTSKYLNSGGYAGHNIPGATLHPNYWSHLDQNDGYDNSIGIIRMKTTWPANNNYGSWENIYRDHNKTLHDWYVGGYKPRTQTYSDIDYILSPQSDERVEVTQMVKNIVTDNRGGLNYSTGLRILTTRIDYTGLIQHSNRDKFQCFWTQNQPYSVKQNPTPYLSIYYWQCGDTTIGSSIPGDNIVNTMVLCSSATQTYSFCRSKFSKKSINPYVEGIWGNWRVDTTYAYYSDRKEQDISAAPDLRIAGTINNFKTFWNFSTSSLQRNTSASDVWVWTSTITQYNRKGYDIENKDPLGRYNAGLYGYNQQLPVAVVNNSRYRESMFDGFEDYDYNSNGCNEFCKTRRHANFTNIESSIDFQYKHSGKSSLKVNTGATATLNAPVVPEYTAEAGYRMRVKVDSTSYTTTVVTPRGTGFKGKFYNSWGSSCDAVATNANTMLAGSPQAVRSGEQINYNMSNFSLPGGITYNRFAIKWEGYIQPTISGNHSFMISADDGYRMKIEISGNTQTIADRWNCNWGTNTVTSPVSLSAGQLYKVTVDYFDNTGDQFIQLVWKTPSNPSSWEVIPSQQVYSPDNVADANGTVSTTTIWCTKLDSVQVRANALTDTFSLVQGKKMVISTWVKEGGNDCKCSTYTKSAVNISFTGSSTTYQFKPTGSIIEGWQRYEGEFLIPANATAIAVGLANSGTQPAWFDDIRIHPYNANMKSFVYHPQNLRLMAEMDENNYGSFYEYDDDGTLIRVKKETINGIKTIKETRSALQRAVAFE